MRHGEAGRAASDAERRLTTAGRDVVTQHARRLITTGFRPGIIVSSPLVRARETAALVKEAAFPDARLAVDDALIPGGVPWRVLELVMSHGMSLADNEGDADILLVGHQPLIGNLVAGLTGQLVSIQPGTILGVTMRSGPGNTDQVLPNNGDCSLTWVID